MNGINNRITFPLWKVDKMLLLLLLLPFLFSSCSSSKRTTKEKEPEVSVDTLSPELRRKCNYYFLEAMRQKQKGEYDVAFELLGHALALDPNDASALYEISQF
ncbi:MAG: hypothetical protein RSA92_02135, partial [Bacteroidaceae bacterium]